MRLLNSAEVWEKAYQAFQQVNFSAWDSSTIKQSLIDYLKLYHSEDFNDFIESSELIAYVELFAYVGELFAYRLDLDAHENFITTAERKESILRLAKLLSYNASRNIPARGLVKIMSIATTEVVFDSSGNNLANKIIYWNDTNNINWKEQFVLVLNRIFEQNFGTVLPSDRVQVQDVVFELYGLNNQPLTNQVIPYNITVSGTQYPMELVSAELNADGPLEKRPQLNQVINVLYLNDGLGDSSDNTGFFFFTKQGSLQRSVTSFDGVTPNQTFDVLIENSNQTDVWVNNIDPATGVILTDTTSGNTVVSGEWVQVDVESGQNILFNTNANRNKYEIETLDNDQFRLLFGDGNFSAIPSGTFEVWSRTSANLDLVIPTSSIQNLSTSIFYLDNQGKQQTFTFTFSLTDVIQNAAPTEDIEHIRRVAPSYFYTQDRMVNGRDLNEFMLQDNTILKLRSINRTFAGDSRYIAWHDPTTSYDNVKMFGSDLVVYFKTTQNFVNISNSDLPSIDGGANIARINAIIDNYLQPLLSNSDVVIKELLGSIVPANLRKQFKSDEVLNIEAALTNAINSAPSIFFITYYPHSDQWLVTTTQPDDVWLIVTAYANGDFSIIYSGKYIVAHSDEMKFWITNNADKVLNYDTLNNTLDTITLLQANIGTSGILTKNYDFLVLKQDVIDGGSDAGTSSVNDVVLLPTDSDNNGLPDNVTLDYLINPATDFVYFSRSVGDNGGMTQWTVKPATTDNIIAYEADLEAQTGLWKREVGKYNLNFLWLHSTPNYHLIDPSPSNIVDTYIVTRGYYQNLNLWLNGLVDERPSPPTPFELRNDYNYLVNNKMISDTLVLHSANIKIIVGQYAPSELKAVITVVKSQTSNLTNNQIKTNIVALVNQFFDINLWEFGETFYFPELSTYIQTKLPLDVSAVVLVPVSQANIFGDLFQVYAGENEIIQPSISVNDIQIVDSLDPRTFRQV
jgi:hypothetical protein